MGSFSQQILAASDTKMNVNKTWEKFGYSYLKIDFIFVSFSLEESFSGLSRINGDEVIGETFAIFTSIFDQCFLSAVLNHLTSKDNFCMLFKGLIAFFVLFYGVLN